MQSLKNDNQYYPKSWNRNSAERKRQIYPTSRKKQTVLASSAICSLYFYFNDSLLVVGISPSSHHDLDFYAVHFHYWLHYLVFCPLHITLSDRFKRLQE